jgi:hypothetical protein
VAEGVARGPGEDHPAQFPALLIDEPEPSSPWISQLSSLASALMTPTLPYLKLYTDGQADGPVAGRSSRFLSPP